MTEPQSYETFEALHAYQLQKQGVPKCLWPQLHELIVTQTYDAGDHVQLSRFSDLEGSTDDNKLMCIATHTMEPDSVRALPIAPSLCLIYERL